MWYNVPRTEKGSKMCKTCKAHTKKEESKKEPEKKAVKK